MTQLNATSVGFEIESLPSAWLSASAHSDCAPTADAAIKNQSARFALPKHMTISICVISGPSKGLTYQFSKPLTSIGRTGGGADIQIDDPSLSGLHCAMGVRQDVIRLCDLDSTTGIYSNHERVQAADLEHLSEFRVGSSLLLVTILPKREIATT
jgi:pSer/pThr/pTyr-binding forkhead associated (FHA) protein